MSEQSNENVPPKSPLKSREELVAEDFVGVETDDGRIVFGYLAGQIGNFLYIFDEMSLDNPDLSNIRASKLFPEYSLYTGGVRAININNIRSYFTPSFPIRSLYQHTLNQILSQVEEKIQEQRQNTATENNAPDVEFSFEDLVGDNKTVH